jgi:hypothetical protein
LPIGFGFLRARTQVQVALMFRCHSCVERCQRVFLDGSRFGCATIQLVMSPEPCSVSLPRVSASFSLASSAGGTDAARRL